MSETETAFVKYTLEIEGVKVKFVGDLEYQGELNTPYKLDVFAMLEVPPGVDIIEFNRSLRQRNAKLKMKREGLPPEIEIKGLVANSMYEFSPEDHDPDEANDDRRGFNIIIEPAFGMLKFHRDKPQAWHNRTYNYVLEKVLSEELAPYGRTVENRAAPGSPVPLITRSPGESALKFCQRLMFEGGINSFFTFDAGQEVLVLCRENGDFDDAKLPYEGPISLLYSERISFVANIEYLAESGSSEAVRQGFDPIETPPINIDETTGLDDGLQSAARELRWTHVRHGNDGAENPHRESVDEHGLRSTTGHYKYAFDTSLLDSFAGRKYKVKEKGAIVPHVITKAHFKGGIGKYLNRAVATPTKTPQGKSITIRTALERPPQMYHGVSLARVATSGAAVDTDERLWCKVKFVWDTTGEDEPVTRVPVMQPMGGAFGGSQWIPREGDVVIVAFLEGSRENPIIIGCQYDVLQSPLHMGPSSTPGHMVSEAKAGAGERLPASDSWLGWSYSSIAGNRPSSNARTMLAMNVAEGSELIYTNAPRDYRLDVVRNADSWIKGKETHYVKGKFTEEIGGKHEHTVKANSKHDIKGNYDLKVKMNGSLDLGITGSVEAKTMLTLACKALIECRSAVFKISSPAIQFSSMPVVGGGAGGAATAYSSFKIERAAELTAPEAVRFESGPSKVHLKPNRVDVDAEAIKLESSDGGVAKLRNGEMVIDVPKGITLRCGDTQIKITDKGVEITGDEVKIKTSKSAKIESGRLSLEADDLKIDADKVKLAAKRFDVSG